jgi:hypothetical protein
MHAASGGKSYLQVFATAEDVIPRLLGSPQANGPPTAVPPLQPTSTYASGDTAAELFLRYFEQDPRALTLSPIDSSMSLDDDMGPNEDWEGVDGPPDTSSTSGKASPEPPSSSGTPLAPEGVTLAPARRARHLVSFFRRQADGLRRPQARRRVARRHSAGGASNGVAHGVTTRPQGEQGETTGTEQGATLSQREGRETGEDRKRENHSFTSSGGPAAVLRNAASAAASGVNGRMPGNGVSPAGSGTVAEGDDGPVVSDGGDADAGTTAAILAQKYMDDAAGETITGMRGKADASSWLYEGM